MKLRLVQKLSLEGFIDPIEAHYNNSYKIPVEIAGETIEYVVCPKTFMGKYGNDTKVGFREDFHDGCGIFLPKDQHPALAPFFALYLHYSGLTDKELEQRFGEGSLSDLDHIETEALLLGTVLDLAKDVLRPGEMNDLITRLKKDELYTQKNEAVVQEVVNSYLPATSSPAALVAREEQSLEFYVDRVSARVRAHWGNKHIRRSRSLDSIQKFVNRDIGRAWIVSSVPAHRRVMENEDYRNNLPQIVTYLEQLETIKVGEAVTLNREESSLMYNIYDAAMESRKSEPFKFIDGNDGENFLEATGQTVRFLGSLKTLFLKKIADDYEQAERQLAKLPQIVKKVIAGDDDLTSRVHNVLGKMNLLPEIEEESAAALVPYQEKVEISWGLGELEDGLKEEKLSSAHVLTSAPQELTLLSKALRARELLEALNINTGDVDQKITAINESRGDSLRKQHRPELE